MPQTSPCQEAKGKEALVTPPATDQTNTPIQSVVISLENGVQISKKNLNDQELSRLIEKLETLC